jgi:hypothetical protein
MAKRYEVVERPKRESVSSAVIDTAISGMAVQFESEHEAARAYMAARAYCDRRRLECRIRKSGLCVWAEPKS